MSFDDLIERLLLAAKETGDNITDALSTLLTKDNEVIGKYVLVLAIAGLLIFGLRLLNDEIKEYRDREGNEHKKLPWYLRYTTLVVAIIILYAILFVLILR
jgi:hypothetical protein